MSRLALLAGLALLVLGACGTSRPRPDPALQQQPTPARLAAGAATARPEEVLTWGGRVRAVHNLRDRTRIEIAAHPLDAHRRPLPDLPANGRFVAEIGRFLEPRELPGGTAVTVQGRYLGLRDGLPLLRVERLDVWPQAEAPRSWRPTMNLGIGGGTGGVSIGIGVGVEIGR